MGSETAPVKPHRPLTERQIEVAAEIAKGQTRAQAAKATGTPLRTLYKWLERADFRAQIERDREAYLNGAFGALVAVGRSAVIFLHDVMAGRVASDNLPIRVRSATALLNGLTGIYRLRALERMALAAHQRDDVTSFIEERVGIFLEAFKGHPEEQEKFLAALRAKDESDERDHAQKYR